jgi:DNA-binding transcriptional LysR family regulator
VTPLLLDPLVAVGPSAQTWPRRGALTAAEVARQPLIVYERGGTIRRVIDGWFRRGGVRPRIVMELGNEEAIKKLVGAGLGVSVSPIMAMRDEVRAGALSMRPLSPALVRRLGLVRRRDKPETPALRMFLAAITALASENRAKGRSPAGGAAGRAARRVSR